ncbi:hypothetical protein [Aquifex pyrophilus]
MSEEKKNKSQAKKSSKPQFEYDNYSLFLHKQRVELHLLYGNSVMKLEGILRSKARFEVQLILDNGEVLTINRSYIIAIKPIK